MVRAIKHAGVRERLHLSVDGSGETELFVGGGHRRGRVRARGWKRNVPGGETPFAIEITYGGTRVVVAHDGGERDHDTPITVGGTQTAREGNAIDGH